MYFESSSTQHKSGYIKIIGRRTIKRTRSFSVEEVMLEMNGRKFKDYAVCLSETASVLAFVNKRDIVLERQFRAPVGKYIYEIPAGHVEKGENPSRTARRELREETGYVPAKLSYAAKFYPSPGTINELQHLYIAKDLKKSKASPEPDEDLRVRIVPFEKAMSMMDSGEIIDAKTMIALLYYGNHYKKG